MKKVMFYGPKDIRIEDAPIPEPAYGEIIVRNQVALTCGTDVKTYLRGYPGDIPPYGLGVRCCIRRGGGGHTLSCRRSCSLPQFRTLSEVLLLQKRNPLHVR